MEEDDDRWSYSLPSSTEDLPHADWNFDKSFTHAIPAKANLIKDAPPLRSTDCNGNHSMNYDNTLGDLINKERPLVGNKMFKEHFQDTAMEGKATKNPVRISPEQLSQPNSGVYDEYGFATKISKQPSLALQPAFMSKSAPADPQTTKKDANSIISKENASNALASGVEVFASPSSSPVSRGADFRSSIKIWQEKTNEGEVCQNPDQVSGTEVISSASPKIITYRKTTHVREVSNSFKLDEQEDKYDSKLYVSEKFKDTGYHFATMKRNVEYHQLFKSIDLTDRLLDDFACAISREILLQGRIYITENNLCFNSNLLGWVTSLVIPFADIIRIDKKSTAGLFPNGIVVETKTSKHNFASFLSRDATFDFARTVWSATTGKDVTELDIHPIESDSGRPGVSERRISDYIMSIDEGENVDVKWNENHFEDSDEESLGSKPELCETEIEGPNFESQRSGFMVKTMRPDSIYKNRGPDAHGPTKISFESFESDNETEVMKTTILAPLGAVFEILFGRDNIAFHEKNLRAQGASDISAYGSFEHSEGGEKKLERSYTYQRPLGYSIGPKSTKCCVKEIIEHLDYEDFIVVLSITDTPDVPSGGSFSVMTRFYLNWSANNSTDLRISFHVNWVGRSWIKSMVEKSTLSAQISVAKMLVESLNQEVEEQIHVADVAQTQSLTETKKVFTSSSKEPPTHEILAVSEEKLTPSLYQQHQITYALVGLVFLLFAIVVYLHLRASSTMHEVRDLMITQQNLIHDLMLLLKDEGSCVRINTQLSNLGEPQNRR